MKCGEETPTCIQCRKMHLECGCYMTKKSTDSCAKARLLPLASKSFALLTTAIPFICLPGHQLFRNEQESNYFKVFCDTNAVTLAECLDAELWSRIVLQASQQESLLLELSTRRWMTRQWSKRKRHLLSHQHPEENIMKPHSSSMESRSMGYEKYVTMEKEAND